MYPGDGRAEGSQGCTAVDESRDPGSREVPGARHGVHPCCPVLGKKAECTPEGRRHLTSCHQEGHGRVGSREGRGPQQGRQKARGTRYAQSRGQTPSSRADSSTLTDGTEVSKPVLTLLGVDKVIPALLGSCPLQHCFKQAWGEGAA